MLSKYTNKLRFSINIRLLQAKLTFLTQTWLSVLFPQTEQLEAEGWEFYCVIFHEVKDWTW